MNGAAWNQLPDVRSPVGRTAADLLAEGPRRQALTRPGVVSTGLLGVRLRCNDFMFSPPRTQAYMATMPAATAGATTPASLTQGAVKG